VTIVVADDERWTGRQQWLVFLTALTIIFDGLDNQLIGITLPAIMRDWNVARSAFAPVVSLGYLGMMIGGVLAGYSGDRLGRRSALLGSILVFGAATLSAPLTHDVGMLAVLRLIAGMGLGGAMPNATALAAEYVPRHKRALAITLTIVCVPVGGVLGGLMAVPVLPAFGWHGMFVIGGSLPIVLALVLTQLLPESPRFLENARAGGASAFAKATADRKAVPYETARSSPFASLFHGEFLISTLGLWTAFVGNSIAVYLAYSWLPSILSSAGLGSAVASSGLTAFNLGGVAGSIAGAFLINRFGSRMAILGMGAGSLTGALVLSRMAITAGSSVPVLIAMLAATGWFINAVQVALFALAAHVYPTPMRATGVGMALTLGRSGAILSGYMGPWALAYGGSAAFFGLMAAFLCVTLVGPALVRRHITASR
jgi:AAHS family 4-hydroxybenzoate transporter-like MFS transporter